MEVSRLRVLFLIAIARRSAARLRHVRCAARRAPPRSGACGSRDRDHAASRRSRSSHHRTASRTARDQAREDRHRRFRDRCVFRHAQHRGLRKPRRVRRSASRITSPKTFLSKAPLDNRAPGAPATRTCPAPPTSSPTTNATTPITRLSLGWNVLPGEVFIGENRAYNSAFYLVAGIGSTTFAGDDRFTVSGGFGYRVLPFRLDRGAFRRARSRVRHRSAGEKKIVNNLEAHLGLSIFF